MPWRRVWQRTPVFLPAEPHGQRSLVGYSPRGRKEPDRPEALSPSPCLQPAVTRSPESLRGPPRLQRNWQFRCSWEPAGGGGDGGCFLNIPASPFSQQETPEHLADVYLVPALLPFPGDCSAAEATGTPGTLFLGSPRVSQLRTRSSQVSGEVLWKNADV